MKVIVRPVKIPNDNPPEYYEREIDLNEILIDLIKAGYPEHDAKSLYVGICLFFQNKLGGK